MVIAELAGVGCGVDSTSASQGRDCVWVPRGEVEVRVDLRGEGKGGVLDMTELLEEKGRFSGQASLA